MPSTNAIYHPLEADACKFCIREIFVGKIQGNFGFSRITKFYDQRAYIKRLTRREVQTSPNQEANSLVLSVPSLSEQHFTEGDETEL